MYFRLIKSSYALILICLLKYLKQFMRCYKTSSYNGQLSSRLLLVRSILTRCLRYNAFKAFFISSRSVVYSPGHSFSTLLLLSNPIFSLIDSEPYLHFEHYFHNWALELILHHQYFAVCFFTITSNTFTNKK